jgi:Family of unknown function (DUF6492)
MLKKLNFVFLLKTYIGDIEYVDRLILSYEKYNRDNITLYIVVPKSDYEHFKKYISDKIFLLNDESITNCLVSDYSVRGIRPGYVNQEIIKIAFWEKKLAENYLCLDSDGEFIRDFFVSDFMYDEKTPYTILVEDNELAVDPEYYKEHWVERKKLIMKIQKEVGLDDRRMLTCHGLAVLSSLVLESLYNNYLLPSKQTYIDILKISPYEFSWYNMWLQKDKTIKIEIREPYFKVFHNKNQHLDYIRKGITKEDISRGYLGVVVNSNYSRGSGVISYDDVSDYLPSMKEMKNDLTSSLYRIIKFLPGKIWHFISKK